ncbi:MAG: DUF167 domain-containing protein [Patescibacteria group bacterium]
MTRITVQIIPNAKENAVVGHGAGAWKIRVKAPPIEGKANEALIRFIADILDIAPSNVEIVKGQLAKKKTIQIQASSSEVENVFTKCIQANGASRP